MKDSELPTTALPVAGILESAKRWLQRLAALQFSAHCAVTRASAGSSYPVGVAV